MAKISYSADLKEYDKRTFNDRLRRMQFAMEATGRESPYMLPAYALGYFYDADVCLVFGAFAACIVMCQLVCEEMLKSPYRDKGVRKVVESNFQGLIGRALSDGFVDAETARDLNEIRKVRNAIAHSKNFSRLSETNERSHLMIIDGYISNSNTLEVKAKQAFLIASKLLRRGLYLRE